MKILISLKTGALRLAGAWKGILVTWIVSVLVACPVILPLKSAMTAAYGTSMITERLGNAIDLEVLIELGPALESIMASFSVSLLILILMGFVINVFLSGGLFGSVSAFRREFWSSCGKNFWAFLVISLITGIVTMLMFSLVISLPVLLTGFDGVESETQILRALIIAFSVFLVILPILILWMDYARAWQARSDRNRSLAALGFGLGRTFRTFLSSWTLVVLMLFIQAVYWWLIVKVLPGMQLTIGIPAFFLVSQIAVIIRIVLRVYRYSCVTSLMEQTNPV